MKKVLLEITLATISISLFAFDWPLQNINTDNLKSFFAQKRGQGISSSLIIEKQKETDPEAEPEQVKTSESGKVIALLNEFTDDNDFFPSTLGNAVIISHTDGILSVYGNLDKNSMETSLHQAQVIAPGASLGTTGSSAWSDTGTTLEFQILDSKNKTAINPRILLSRIEKEGTFPPSDIIVENKDGKHYELSNMKVFQAGTYKFFQKRNESLVPLKTILLLNGEVTDELHFDHLLQEENQIKMSGTEKKYSGTEIYPSDKLLFSGEARLTPGKLVLTFENYNHNGIKRIVNYNISVY
ncbi:MAG: M23 family metallopeptidase [Treponema sp.]|nr:M23 family metallopeptidase [Treponema sp.]